MSFTVELFGFQELPSHTYMHDLIGNLLISESCLETNRQHDIFNNSNHDCQANEQSSTFN